MNDDKIVGRIRKMLALANDLAASEGERENALRMAYSTMAKYNIDMARVDGAVTDELRIDFHSQSFSWQWARSINQTIGKLFFCYYFTGAKVNGTQSVHHFIGKESNAMTAAVMADWIVKSILKEARSMYRDNTCPETRSFALGAAHALHHRVKAIREAEAGNQEQLSTGTAVVLANLYTMEESANEEFLAGLGYKLKTRAVRASTVHSDAYSSGKRFGDNINLDKQLGVGQKQLA